MIEFSILKIIYVNLIIIYSVITINFKSYNKSTIEV